MDAPLTLAESQVRAHVGEAEWATRVDLAACYRLLAVYGMTDLIYNHVSARIPGSREQYLINPYGMLYEEITASSLVKIDVEGRTLLQPDHGYNVNVAGFYLHAPIHLARPDVRCIIHTHTRAGTAVSALAEGLLPLSQTAMRFHGRVAYHDFEGPAINGAECARVVDDLGPHDILMLRNHGLLVCGLSIAQAFNAMYWLENACRIQVDILGCSRAIHHPTGSAIANTVSCFSGEEITLTNEARTNPVLNAAARTPHGGYGSLEWPALLRKLDRLDPSYRN
ncbi:ribulose-5-phosphate 4-epimerase-like epimerase or aldolase [Polaromonas sp. CF318]|uniref:class II aldolase/adducin family protein n=1 Tax=Polaromonas sp. CF318 TaxID=1144318 RepID=UPI000270F9C6|nr:class II aldolase/adducin family protein [Polaromonas sp. CF318]EJL82527.1 ribulose-5-phosphate 4-epimerase-like epimerase or aldolase [Polaromonas sp. CF318]